MSKPNYDDDDDYFDNDDDDNDDDQDVNMVAAMTKNVGLVHQMPCQSLSLLSSSFDYV